MGSKGLLLTAEGARRALLSLGFTYDRDSTHDHVYRYPGSGVACAFPKKGIYSRNVLSKLLHQMRQAGVNMTQEEFLRAAR